MYVGEHTVKFPPRDLEEGDREPEQNRLPKGDKTACGETRPSAFVIKVAVADFHLTSLFLLPGSCLCLLIKNNRKVAYSGSSSLLGKLTYMRTCLSRYLNIRFISYQNKSIS